MESFADAVDGNVIDLLLRYQYVILETITESNSGLILIRVSNKYGDYCYVKVTKDQVVDRVLNTVVTIKVESTRVEPTTQILAVDYLCNLVDGVVFETIDEFCVVTKQDDSTIVSTAYTIVKRNSDLFESPVAFPLITIDHIIQDDLLCSIRVRESTKSIQKEATSQINQSNLKTLSLSSNLEESVSRLVSRVKEIQDYQLNKTDQIFAMINRGQVEAEQVGSEVRDLNKFCIELLKYNDQFNTIRRDIQKLIHQTNDAYWSLFIKCKTHLSQEVELSNLESWGLSGSSKGINLNQIPVEKLAQLLDTTNPNSVQLLRLLNHN